MHFPIELQRNNPRFGKIRTMLRVALIFIFAYAFAGGRMLLDKRSIETRNVTRSKTLKYCENPVQKERVHFKESLVGRVNIDFEMYSGYVPVTDAPDYLFYWFFSSRDGNKDAPLIIWTNGGPGCSSMEAVTTENGPMVLLDIKESCTNTDGNCAYTEQFSNNVYSWNNHANILYLDQPRYVGYSFGYGEEVKRSTTAAKDVVTFYLNWLKHFPEFTGRRLIIAGESYGGHYLPAWADAINSHNAKVTEQEEKIPLGGVLIGNGCTNSTVQGLDTVVEFGHLSNLIPKQSNPKTRVHFEEEMVRHIGYTPNNYDFRLNSVQCAACEGYNYTAWSEWLMRDDVQEALHICGDAGYNAFAGNGAGCIDIVPFDADDTFDYSGALGRTLDLGIPVTLYYGKVCGSVCSLAIWNVCVSM